jgi:hypothetical protein
MVNNSTNVNETETQIIEHKKTKMEKETARNELKFGREHLWKVLYKDLWFRPYPLTNMVDTCNSCFRMVYF